MEALRALATTGRSTKVRVRRGRGRREVVTGGMKVASMGVGQIEVRV
jgi:hypothetical protein